MRTYYNIFLIIKGKIKYLSIKLRKLKIRYPIPLNACVVGITVKSREVCASGKIVVISAFLCDDEKILGDVGMVFSDVDLLGDVVVIFGEVDKISGHVDAIFVDVGKLSVSVVLNVSSVVEFVSPAVRLRSVDNLSGEVNVSVVIELSSTFDVIPMVEERYGEIVVILSGVIVVPGEFVWVTWFADMLIL